MVLPSTMFIDSSSSKEPIRIMFSPAWVSQEYWAKGESQKKPQREREGRGEGERGEMERERAENVCTDHGTYTVRRKGRTMGGVMDYEKMLVIKI